MSTHPYLPASSWAWCKAQVAAVCAISCSSLKDVSLTNYPSVFSEAPGDLSCTHTRTFALSHTLSLLYTVSAVSPLSSCSTYQQPHHDITARTFCVLAMCRVL
jgi:hypothetical protein